MMTNHEEIKAVFRQVFHHDQDDSDDDAYQDVFVYLCICSQMPNTPVYLYLSICVFVYFFTDAQHTSV